MPASFTLSTKVDFGVFCASFAELMWSASDGRYATKAKWWTCGLRRQLSKRVSHGCPGSGGVTPLSAWAIDIYNPSNIDSIHFPLTVAGPSGSVFFVIVKECFFTNGSGGWGRLAK